MVERDLGRPYQRSIVSAGAAAVVDQCQQIAQRELERVLLKATSGMVVTVGRGPYAPNDSDSYVRVHYRAVDQRHLHIKVTPAGYELTPRNTTNGTYLVHLDHMQRISSKLTVAPLAQVNLGGAKGVTLRLPRLELHSPNLVELMTPNDMELALLHSPHPDADLQASLVRALQRQPNHLALYLPLNGEPWRIVPVKFKPQFLVHLTPQPDGSYRFTHPNWESSAQSWGCCHESSRRWEPLKNGVCLSPGMLLRLDHDRVIRLPQLSDEHRALLPKGTDVTAPGSLLASLDAARKGLWNWLASGWPAK